MTSFLEELWVFPFRLHSPFLGKCISYSVCNVDPSPGGVEPQASGGGWPSMPLGGAGGNCIETSPPKQTGVGLKDRVQSQPSTCTLWGR